MTAAIAALDIADWRRRVFALYAEVRGHADPAGGHRRWCAGRDELFATHPASPLLPADRARFGALPVAPYDPAWRFDLPIAPVPDPARLDLVTGTDGVVALEQLGRVVVPEVGALDVWRHAGYGGGLFVPLRDGSAGAGGSYGGGRYLLDTIKGADLGPGATPGSLVLDFNFAYNPSCAYDPAWACPLAPVGNVIAVPVPVGERDHGL